MADIHYLNGFYGIASYPDHRVLTGDSQHPAVFPSFTIHQNRSGQFGYSIEKDDGESPISLFNSGGTVSEVEIGKMLAHIVRQTLGTTSDPKALIAMNDSLVRKVVEQVR